MVKLNDYWTLGLRVSIYVQPWLQDLQPCPRKQSQNEFWECQRANIHERLFLEAWLSIKGSSIWKWPHCHPRSLLVGTYILSLVLRFLENSVWIFFSTCPTCWFLNCGYQHYISINEGLLALAKMSWTKYQNNPCQTIILKC